MTAKSLVRLDIVISHSVSSMNRNYFVFCYSYNFPLWSFIIVGTALLLILMPTMVIGDNNELGLDCCE